MDILAAIAGLGSFAGGVLRLMLGFAAKPNIVLGDSPEANSSDPRLAYKRWFHVSVENRHRTRLSKLRPTKDAEACTVSLEFTSGANAVVLHDGVFLVSDTEMPKASITLVVDRRTYIPVYILAPQPMTIPGLGIQLPTGAYVTSGRFFHPDLLQTVHLDPGTYTLVIAVKPKNGRRESRPYSVTIPDFDG